MGIWLFSTKYE